MKIKTFFISSKKYFLNIFVSIMTSLFSGLIIAWLVIPQLSPYWLYLNILLISILFLISGVGYFLSLNIQDRVVVVTYIDPSIPFVSSFLSSLVSELQIKNKTIDVVYNKTVGEIRQLPESIESNMNSGMPPII